MGHLLTLCQEYLALIKEMRSGNLDETEYQIMSGMRTTTHDELIRITGFDRPFNMEAYALDIVSRKDGEA